MAKFTINCELKDGTLDASRTIEAIEADTENAALAKFNDVWRTYESEWRSAELVKENGTRVAVKYAEPD